MPDKSDEFGWVTWLEKWERRGELAVTIGATALFTWVAAALPTQATTHVAIWPPIVVSGALIAVAVYVLVAVEKGWWLPGKGNALGKAHARARWEMFRGIQEREQRSPEAEAMERVANALERLLARMEDQ